MAQLLGNDLTLAVGTDGSEMAFAHAQSFTWSFSNSLVDITDLEDANWDNMLSGRKSISISTNTLADWQDATGRQSTEQYTDIAHSGMRTFFQVTRTGGTVTSGDFLGWSGEAIIESIELSVEESQAVTAAITLKVVTEPTKVLAS